MIRANEGTRPLRPKLATHDAERQRGERRRLREPQHPFGVAASNEADIEPTHVHPRSRGEIADARTDDGSVDVAARRTCPYEPRHTDQDRGGRRQCCQSQTGARQVNNPRLICPDRHKVRGARSTARRARLEEQSRRYSEEQCGDDPERHSNVFGPARELASRVGQHEPRDHGRAGGGEHQTCRKDRRPAGARIVPLRDEPGDANA